MANAAASSRSRATSPSGFAALPSALASSSTTQILTSDSVPPLAQLDELAQSLNAHKEALAARKKRIDRGIASAARYGSSSAGPSRSGSRAAESSQQQRESKSSPREKKAASGAGGTTGGSRTSLSRRQSVASAAERMTPPLGSPAHPLALGTAGKGKGREQTASDGRASPPVTTTESGTPSRLPKIKIKREVDREDGLGLPSSLVASPPLSLSQTGSERLKRDNGEVDLDDALPNRPGRTYAKIKRKNRTPVRSGSRTMDESEDDGSDVAMSVDRDSMDLQGESSFARRRTSQDRTATSSGPPSRPLGIRLKLNPTQAPSGIAALGAAHQPTGLYGEHSAHGSGSSFLWTLPEEPASLIPPAPISRPPKGYPIRPDDVDEDFTALDWKERERQRDREEALTSLQSANASPAPGQTHLQKESSSLLHGGAIGSAAANRVRSQNQQQVTYQVFQTYVEGWFKSLTDEDIAWLSRREEEPEAFEHPPIGRHYTEVWAQEDAEVGPLAAIAPSSGYHVDGGNPSGMSNGHSHNVHHKVSAFEPRHLADEHALGTALTEAKSGPLTERLLSMVLPVQKTTAAHEEQAMQSEASGSTIAVHTNGIKPSTPSNVNGNGSSQPPLPSSPRQSQNGSHAVAPAPVPTQDLAQYEERLKRELRLLDILGPEEDVDWSNRQDDEISSTLRKVQSLLSSQIDINESRKARLGEIAKGRMGYQEYLSCLLNVERGIEQGWLKRQALLKKYVSKKKGAKDKDPKAATDGRAGTPADVTGIVSSLPPHLTGGSSTSAASSPRPLAGQEAATLIGSNDPQLASSSSLDPYDAYNALATNRLDHLPPLTESLLGAMRQREILKKAFEPLFAPEQRSGLEVRRVPSSEEGGEGSVYSGLGLKGQRLEGQEQTE